MFGFVLIRLLYYFKSRATPSVSAWRVPQWGGEGKEHLTGLSSEYVEELGGDGLLAQFVVLELQLVEEFLGVVVGALHCHDTRSLL